MHLLIPNQIHRALVDLKKLENRLRNMDETFRQDVVKVTEAAKGPESDVEQAISTLQTILNDVDDRVCGPARLGFDKWLGEASIALAYRTVIEDLKEYETGGG